MPLNFDWYNCLSLKHVSLLLSFSILPNIFRILAILFQKLAKTGGLEWLSHYNCRALISGHVKHVKGGSSQEWSTSPKDKCKGLILEIGYPLCLYLMYIIVFKACR